MAAYNAEEFLEEAIVSVLRQSFSNWELILINDGSVDRTGEIVNAFAKKEKRIKLINQDNQGLTAARKAGMSLARGKWIAFLDADDKWLPDKLWLQHKTLMDMPDIDVIFCDGYTLTADVPILIHYHFDICHGRITGKEMFEQLFKTNVIPILSACFRKTYADLFLDQDNNLIGAEDWDYWLTLAGKGAIFYGMQERMFVYRLRKESMSSNQWQQLFSSARILLKHFDPDKLSPETISAFNQFVLSTYLYLRKAGKYTHAEKMLSDCERHSLPLRIKVFGFKNIVKKYNSLIKITLKRMLLTLLQILFFKPFDYYLKHSHNLRIQFFRWKMGKQLETKGKFFIEQNAEIVSFGSKTKFTTYGFYISKYSRINLSGKAQLFTGTEVRLNSYCNFNVWDGVLLLGNGVLFNNYCSVNCMESISIGDQTWFGEGVRIYDHNHEYKDPSKPFIQQGMRTGRISIGSNCWIGSNTVILQNVTIGNNCVIGANNLIYRSIPNGTIVKANGPASELPIYA